MSIFLPIENSWKKILHEEFEKPYFKELKKFLTTQIQEKKIIYPDSKKIFAAFESTSFNDVRVVILGQDPYHGPNQAHGLSFSVPKDQKKIPPSLKNIFKELGNTNPAHGNLQHWADQGVLLLNATLSVEAGKAGSHQNKGWETFTDRVMTKISEEKKGIIFLLWGAYAQQKSKLIDTKKHTVLTSSHPSPLSSYRGFLGCGHFITVNKVFSEWGQKSIKFL